VEPDGVGVQLDPLGHIADAEWDTCFLKHGENPGPTFAQRRAIDRVRARQLTGSHVSHFSTGTR